MKKRILALSLVLMMVLTVFAGCKETAVVEDLDYDAIVMTVGENEITLREMYFMLKWNQSTYQAMAKAQFGEDWYEQDLTGEGPFGDYIKDNIVSQMEEMYILCDNAEKYNMSLSEEDLAKIETVVAEMMSSNTEEALGAMGLTEDIARKVATNYTLWAKVYNEIIRDVDTSVTTEEAAQKTYDYIYQQLTTYNEDGTTSDMTSDEINSYYALLKMVKDEVEAGKTFDEAAEEYGFSVASHSFGQQDDGTFNDINGLADELKVGEVSDIIPVDGGVFLLCLESDFDEEATEEARTTLASEKQLDAFEAEYEKLKEGVTIELDEELWATCTFEQPVVAYTEAE